jgi:hypothetical protein
MLLQTFRKGGVQIHLVLENLNANFQLYEVKAFEHINANVPCYVSINTKKDSGQDKTMSRSVLQKALEHILISTNEKSGCITVQVLFNYIRKAYHGEEPG